MNIWAWIGLFWLVAVAAFAVVIGILHFRGRKVIQVAKRAVPPELARVVKTTLRLTRAVMILIIGMTLLVLGIIMFVTPGPGLPITVIGLAILGTEFIWARILFQKLHQTASSVGNRTGLTADHLPDDAGPVKRLLFRIGKAARFLAKKWGLVRLAEWIGKRLGIDRVLNDAKNQSVNKQS